MKRYLQSRSHTTLEEQYARMSKSSPWRKCGLDSDASNDAIEVIVFGNHLHHLDNVACSICLARLQAMIDAIALNGVNMKSSKGFVGFEYFPGQCHHNSHITDWLRRPNRVYQGPVGHDAN